MNLINSVTSGMNLNFGNNFFNNFSVSSNNDNNNEEDNEDSIEYDFEEPEDDEENEENEDDMELFLKKKKKFIMELDEFQYKHLKKYSALKEDKCPICKHDLTDEINRIEIGDEDYE